MTRAEHLGVSDLSAAVVAVLLDAVAAVAEPVRLAYLWRPTLPEWPGRCNCHVQSA